MAEQHISRRRVVDAAEQAREALAASLENLQASRNATRAMEKAYDALTKRLDGLARRVDEIDKLQNSVVDANLRRDERFKDHDWFIYQLKKLTAVQWFKLIFYAEFPSGG